MSVAAIPLYGYQRRWLEDTSDLKAGLWCRSSGKTFVETLEITLDCGRNEAAGKKTSWFLFSGAEGQTLEMLQYAKLHATALAKAERAFADLGSLVESEEEEVVEGVRMTMKLVTFERSGSRIVALPTNKLSIRGKHGNLWWDEAGSTPNDDEIWSAAAPIASRKGFLVRLTGTAGKKRGPFYEIMTGKLKGWSISKIDVHQAIADGAPIDLAKLGAMGFRPGTRRWLTECLMEFEDDGQRLIPLELICACEDDGTLDLPFLRIEADRRSEWEPHLDRQLEPSPSEGYDSPAAWKRLFAPLAHRRGALFLGFDVARTKHLAVLWITEVDGLLRRTRAVVAFHDRRWAEMEGALWAALEHCRRACIDRTGNGSQIHERTLERFGEHQVEGVNFSGTAVKEDLALRMERLYEDRAGRIPAHVAIRDSIHSVYSTSTAAGHKRFDAEATEEGGHADYFWGQALSLLAAGDGAFDLSGLETFGERRWSREGGL